MRKIDFAVKKGSGDWTAILSKSLTLGQIGAIAVVIIVSNKNQHLMKRTDKKKEERRLWAAAMILSGMCANYASTPHPSIYWAYEAVDMADYLLLYLEKTTSPVVKNIKDKDKGSKSL